MMGQFRSITVKVSPMSWLLAKELTCQVLGCHSDWLTAQNNCVLKEKKLWLKNRSQKVATFFAVYINQFMNAFIFELCVNIQYKL